MNKLIASLVFVAASLGSFANASEPAAKLIAQVKGISLAIKDAQLFSNGTLVIHDQGRGQQKLKLSESNAERLGYLAESLSGAELTTEHHDIICMMVFNPMFAEELSVTAADASLRVVLSPTSCALQDHTFPKDGFNAKQADDLKGQLIAFAHQLAND